MKTLFAFIFIIVSLTTTGQVFKAKLLTDYGDCLSERTVSEYGSIKSKLLKSSRSSELELNLHNELVFNCDQYFQNAATIRYFEIKNRNKAFLKNYNRFDSLDYFNDLLENGTDKQKQEIEIHRA